MFGGYKGYNIERLIIMENNNIEFIKNNISKLLKIVDELEGMSWYN